MNLCNVQPALAQDVFVAPSAAVIGDVSLGSKASVWYGCVLKGRHGFENKVPMIADHLRVLYN